MRLKASFVSFVLVSLLIVMSIAAAEDVRIEGTAVEKFQRIGAWGWVVSVDRVISGPEEMAGKEISAYLTSANPAEYPPGSIDPDIVAGDHVAVYGSLKTTGSEDYDILLVGSHEYYIKLASS
jgi:hypothetical protein